LTTFSDRFLPISSTGAGRAHLRISNLASGTGLSSYAFSDNEGVIYLEGPSLSCLVEESIGELEERGFG
jgi:hypothetical protein